MPDITSRAVILMGVSGSGKSTVGASLAQRLECPFLMPMTSSAEGETLPLKTIKGQRARALERGWDFNVLID